METHVFKISSLSLPAIIALILLCSCGKGEKATVMAPARVNVEVMGKNISGSPDRTFSGTAESAEATTVSFSVPGTITKIYAEVGQKVGQGQLLARIKDQSLMNSNNIAQAELEEAQDAYRRLKKLHDANALPDIKWVEVQAKLKQAENAAALAGRAVGDASLHSPIAGYVAEKLADDGQTVLAAQPVMRIVKLNDMRMSISVPENEIGSFREGTTATISLAGLNSLSVEGRVEQKDVVANPLTRSYTVKFSIPNPDGKILPGMIGTVRMKGAAADSVASAAESFVLPSQSVLLDADNRQFVWTVRKGRAERRFVVADELSADGVRVTSGLQRGDSVIVAGMQKVSTGTAVSTAK